MLINLFAEKKISQTAFSKSDIATADAALANAAVTLPILMASRPML